MLFPIPCTNVVTFLHSLTLIFILFIFFYFFLPPFKFWSSRFLLCCCFLRGATLALCSKRPRWIYICRGNGIGVLSNSRPCSHNGLLFVLTLTRGEAKWKFRFTASACSPSYLPSLSSLWLFLRFRPFYGNAFFPLIFVSFFNSQSSPSLYSLVFIKSFHIRRKVILSHSALSNFYSLECPARSTRQIVTEIRG